MQQDQEHDQEDCNHGIIKWKGNIYLESDASNVDLRKSLLNMRDGMQFPKNETPSNMALWQVAFTRKILTSVENCYSNIEREALVIYDLNTCKLKDLLNVFDIEDNILILGYDADATDHDKTLKHAMQICL